MNAQDIVAHWRRGSTEDIEAAAVLMERGKQRHGMFFAHLALEKALKAHVARHTGTHPPRIHRLVSLASQAGLDISPEDMVFLGDFDVYQLEGRYPEDRDHPSIPAYSEDFQEAQRLHAWLIRKL